MQTWIRTDGLALTCAAAGLAAAHECKTSDFAGNYAFHGTGQDLRTQPPSPTSLSGTFEPDGTGGFLAWNQSTTIVGAPGPPKMVIQGDQLETARAAGSELRYEVMPNCQMRIFGTILTPFGPIPIEILGALADGGRKALLQTGAPHTIGTGVAERTEPSPMKTLIERIATRLLGIQNSR